jgi:hypothetical protein
MFVPFYFFTNISICLCLLLLHNLLIYSFFTLSSSVFLEISLNILILVVSNKRFVFDMSNLISIVYGS